MKRFFFVGVFFLLIIKTSISQDIAGSQIQGDFQTDFQIYKEDSLINAPKVPENLRANTYLNLVYKRNKISAGIRLESYQNALLGYDPRYKGNGLASRWVNYSTEDIEITVGNFYEQFGSGLILRSYEDRSLGIDNSIDGIKLLFNPYKGIAMKGIIGQHRYFFDKGIGIIRGLDAEINLNELKEKWNEKNLKVILGSAFVSKYQQDKDPVYVLPENVAAFSSRINIIHRRKTLYAEYAYKINDPSSVNKMIYKDGQALYVNGSYSMKGFSVSLSAKRIDNMNFRSDRSATGNVLLINYLPALSIPYTYALAAFYPYSTQSNGEMGIQGRIACKIPKDKPLGGKYGTELSLSFTSVNDIQRSQINDTINIGQSGTLGYNSPFFAIGKDVFYQEVNFEIVKKLNKKIKLGLDNIYIVYNKTVIEGHLEPDVFAHIGILDFTYRFNDTHSLHGELQHLTTEQDTRNWAMGLVELSLAHKWTFGLSDMYNYNNENNQKRLHYFLASVSYVKNASRFALGYGKQREGIVCIGGVCRYVPASNGLSVSVTTNF